MDKGDTMRVLITGGAGFIGSSVVRHFVELGHEVCIADRFTYAGKARNLADILPWVDLLIGDLATGDLAARCAQWRPEWVVHMAAETHVDRSIDAPESFVTSNVLGTTRLLQALYLDLTVDLKKMVVYSTDEVFGWTPQGEIFDEFTLYNPSNAYSASKVGVEAIANSFYVTHDMPIVIVRPCNTYGPGQHPEKVIPKFVRQMLRGEPVTVYNEGNGARDWLHVEDHARAIETLLLHGVPGEDYNLAANEEHSDSEIAAIIGIALGVKHRVIFTPGRPGHDRRYMMDGSKLRALGWSPVVSFEDGFCSTVHWNAANQDWWDSDTIRIAHAPTA